mgnify:FL=1
MAKTAELVGESGNEYSKLAATKKHKFRNTFFNEKELFEKQTFLACIVYQGLCTDKEAEKYAGMLNELIIQNQYHFDCGIL